MLPIIIYGNNAMQDKIQTLIQATSLYDFLTVGQVGWARS